MYMYDEDWDEVVKSDKEYEMNAKGFEFITNFFVKDEVYYRKAAEISELKYRIENEAYDRFGKKYDNGQHSKAFYVESLIGDLTHFWRTFEQLKVESNLD